MTLTKRQAYFAILAAGFILCLLYQSIWIFSRTATAEIYSYSVGKSSGRRGGGISWMQASYRVGSDTYDGTYLKDDDDVRNHQFEIRYLIFSPGLSRANSFESNWGPPIMFFIVLALITSIAFIRKDIISDQAIFVVQPKRPFVKVEQNQIEDYDEHKIENKNPTEAEQDLKKSLETGMDSLREGEISTSVYKFNPNAIGIFIFYVFYFFWFFYSLLKGAIGYPEVFFFGAILVFVPLYVQNTNNATFKAKIPDQGSLVFSTGGIQYKDDSYSIDQIDAAVVYLESFRGFKYRDRVTIGKTNTTSSGDNNKISVRYSGQVMDFTFILDEAIDYWAFKSLMANWSARGINILLQKVFEDEFIVQEMTNFNTPASSANP